MDNRPVLICMGYFQNSYFVERRADFFFIGYEKFQNNFFNIIGCSLMDPEGASKWPCLHGNSNFQHFPISLKIGTSPFFETLITNLKSNFSFYSAIGIFQNKHCKITTYPLPGWYFSIFVPKVFKPRINLKI